MISDNVVVSVVSAFSGIMVAYITVRYKAHNERPKAKDRIDTAFDAFERIIKQQQQDIDDLREDIKERDILIDKLRAKVNTLTD